MMFAATCDRIREVGWVLGHLDDLDADFRSFYGIDMEMECLSGPRFFSLAYRVAAYPGVMQARLEEEAPQKSSDSSQRPRYDTPSADGSGDVEVSLTQFRMMFPGIVDHTEV